MTGRNDRMETSDKVGVAFVLFFVVVIGAIIMQ